MRYILFLTLLVFTAKIQAQEIFVELSNDNIVVNTAFNITYTVNAKVQDFETPNFGSLEIIAGPNKGQQYKYINGKSSYTTTFSYTLLPTKEGVITIPRAKAKVKGNTIASESLSIEVAPKSSIQLNSDADYFIRMEARDTIVSIGQKFQIQYVLYCKTGVGGIDIIKEDDFKGFKSEMGKYVKGYQKTEVDGEPFHKRVLLTYNLYANQAGTFNINGYTINVQIPIQGARPDIFGSVPTKSEFLASNELTIKVKDLNGVAPESYTGGIGRFKMTATTKDTIPSTDDAVTITMNITGTGNPKYWDYPKLKAPESWEAFEPKVTAEKKTMATFGSATKKTIDYVFLPREAGKYEITPEFSYYNADSSKYITITDKTLKFNVTQGKEVVDKLPTDEEIRVPETDEATVEEPTKMNYPLIFGGLLVLGLSGFLLSKVFKSKDKKTEDKSITIKEDTKDKFEKLEAQKPQVEVSESKKSITEPVKKEGFQGFDAAKKLLLKRKYDQFYPELSISLQRYLAEKYNLQNIDLSQDKIVSTLTANGVPEQTVLECRSILQKCEMAIYGGMSVDADELYNRAVNLVKEL